MYDYQKIFVWYVLEINCCYSYISPKRKKVTIFCEYMNAKPCLFLEIYVGSIQIDTYMETYVILINVSLRCICKSKMYTYSLYEENTSFQFIHTTHL